MSDLLKNCYEKYAKDASEAYSNARITDGLFGFGNDPAGHPCHEAFFEEVGRLVKETAAAGDAAAAYEAAEYILRAELLYPQRETVWMVRAAQGHVRLLVPCLTPQKAGELLALMDTISPKRQRFPVQKELARMLREKAGL